MEAPNTKTILDVFESGWNNPTSQDVTAQIVDNISTVYAENSPDFIYFVALYNIFHEFLEDVSQDTLPNEGTGDQYSGGWKTLSTFLRGAAYGLGSRRSRSGNDHAPIQWQPSDHLVIPEAHHFRTGVKNRRKEEKETRYSRLLNEVLAKGVKTKVLMLSATPVNTNFNDLKNQLQLAYVGNSEEFDRIFKGERPVEDIFRRAQTAFKSWSKLPPQERTTPNLLKALDFDFFRLLDSTTIARSRKHIQQYYDMRDVGKFPERLPPKSYSTPLTTDGKIINELNYRANFEKIISLKL